MPERFNDRQVTLQELDLLTREMRSMFEQAPSVARATARRYWTAIILLLVLGALVFGLLMLRQSLIVVELRQATYSGCTFRNHSDDRTRSHWLAMADDEKNPAVSRDFRSAAEDLVPRDCTIYLK